MVVWGTDVVVQDAKRKFKNFLENFIDDFPIPEPGSSELPMDGVTPYYMARLEEVGVVRARRPLFSCPPQISVLEVPFLNVSCEHLLRYNQELYSQLVRYPQETIPTFDLATNELFVKLYPDIVLQHAIQVGGAWPVLGGAYFYPVKHLMNFPSMSVSMWA